MDQNSELQREKREARRKRRVRNQILAYFAAVVLIVTGAVGIVFGIKHIVNNAEKKLQDQQEQLNAMLDGENSIPKPAPPSEEPPVELTLQEKLDMIVDARIEVMPLEDKVAGLFIVTPESITGVKTVVKAGDGTKEALTKYAVGGIIYSAKNIQDGAQLKEMIDNTKLFASYPLFIAVEDEGGGNSPFTEKGLMEPIDDAGSIGASGDSTNAYVAAQKLGMTLASYGINLNLAPVADINSVEDSVMGSRSYGSDAEFAGKCVASALWGLEEQGVDTCLKHFPGMGSTTQNTDEGLASTERSAESFRANEFVVFQTGIDSGADMVLVSNMSAPALAGDNTPCSMSSAVVTDILRNEMGFKGVIITDAMDMKAISEYYGADEAAVMALRAGCDMILRPEDFEKAYNGVLEAVRNGEISEERVNDALRRIYRIKDADKLME